MMKVKLTRFERVAGLFVLIAVAGVIAVGIGAAIKQGWFETKFYYTTTFENADGIHQGSVVQMSGLRAGAVDTVELKNDNTIEVRFYVLGKFSQRVKADSQVQLIRPFVIGERVLDVAAGSAESPVLADGSHVRAVESFDLMTMLSGKKLNSTIEKLTGLLGNLEGLITAFLDKNRTESMIRIFDRLDPLLKNLNAMSIEMTKIGQQANKDQGVEKLVGHLTLTLSELNKVLPQLNEENPELAKDLAVMTQNLAVMTRALGPAMESVEGELPQTSKRLVEALDETVVVLKAMQKSFFMRSSVEEVRKEEMQRSPASK